MGDLGVGEWRERAFRHRQFLGQQLDRLKEANEVAKTHLEELTEARDAARMEAAAAFLPAFDPVSLEMCERLAGLPPGWAAQQQKRVRDEDAALAARISMIEQDANFQRSEALVGASGEWTSQLEEAERALKPHQDLVTRYEALPSFKELVETGYDTPEYCVPAYHFRYYRLWKHADEACEKLSQEPFGIVRQLYLQEVEQRDRRKQKRDEIQKRVLDLARLVNEHHAKVARREALRGAAPLEDSRKLVGDWLAKLDRRALGETLKQAGRQDLLDALVKLDGIEAKSAYLRSMLADESLASELRADMQKLDSDMTKYARPKKAGTRFPGAAIEKRFVSRPERYRRRLAQRRDLVERVYVWDDYDYVDYDDWGSGVPWWYFISGRSDPGYGARFSDVDQWRQSQPDWTYVRHDRPQSSPMDDAAAALADQHVDDGGRDVS